MVLEFVWIENYGVIKNQGFNLNPNVFYSFNEETGELHREIRNKIPDNFFTITNNTVRGITALVGANGTGKSTVLQFISGFLTFSRPLGGFIITDDKVINKSDIQIKLSDNWNGDRPTLFNRLELINNHRKTEGSRSLTEDDDTKNSPLGLRILENLVHDTRLIYYSGEVKLEHTNRVYQSLLSMSDEYENSHYTDMSDIAMMAHDQSKYRTDKAIYSGENPILAYRSGESQRFIELMLSDYRGLIPFTLNDLSLGLTFNDIDSVFFQSYDEMAFKAIANILKAILDTPENKFSKKTIEQIKQIEVNGLGGYFNGKFYEYETANPDDSLKIHLYHRLLLRHVREQLLETMGELTEDNKIGNFVALVSDIERSFLTKKNYLEQIKDYFKKAKSGGDNMGTLSIKSVERFYEKIAALNLWEYEKVRLSLAEITLIDRLIVALREFDEESGLSYKVSTIFDLDIRGLSTGEKQFLKLFSRFLAFDLNSQRNLLEEKQFIILIDEFDLGFHPLWQRKFLHILIQFFESFINKSPEKEIRVQLVLTSHSPFVVSDLPKECIVFLSKGREMKYSIVDDWNKHHATFGANIHELYSDSFFLNGALIGDFAKTKIDQAFGELSGQDSSVNSEFVESIIRVVGEPLLKFKLTEMYAYKTGENGELARWRAQQEYINQRIKEIEEDVTNKKDITKEP